MDLILESKKLREAGYSFSEIAKLTGKSRKFAWRHSKEVRFSKNGLERYHKEVNGIVRQIKPQGKLTPQKVRIIGHVLFDGCSCKIGYGYIVKYINSSKELIDQFTKDIKEVYGINPTYLEVINKPHIINYKVIFSSKLLFEDLKKYFESYSSKNTSPIPDEIMNGAREIKIEFLRAFWEDEGSISAIGRLMADQKNEQTMIQLSELHKEFGFDFRICKYLDYTGTMHKMYFLKKFENLKKFYELNLFDKSRVTHGKNLGRLKKDILNDFIKISDSIAFSHQ